MHPQFAGELDDGALAEEIRLLGALVLAASDARRHLTPDEVDDILELEAPDQERSEASGTDAGPE